MVCFQTKTPNLGKFLRDLDWKMLIYFMAVHYKLWTFGKFCVDLVHFSGFGTTNQEKSGNPVGYIQRFDELWISKLKIGKI
jgi:hypothetical protein